MDRFARLVDELAECDNGTGQQLALLDEYLISAPAADRAWAIYLLWGQRPSRKCTAKALVMALHSFAPWPPWIIDACVRHTGDRLGTCAYLVAASDRSRIALAELMAMDFDVNESSWLAIGPLLSVPAAHVYFQLLTGTFISPAARLSMAEALANFWRCPSYAVQQALVGRWSADRLEAPPSLTTEGAPGALCRLVETSNPMQGCNEEWGMAAFNDGVRVQVVRSDAAVWVWSADGLLLNDAVPEIVVRLEQLPTGAHIDGYLVAITSDGYSDRLSLERRLSCLPGRSTAIERVEFVMRDVLYADGMDVRTRAFRARLRYIERWCACSGLPMAQWSRPTDRSTASILMRMGASYEEGGFLVSRRPIVVRAMLYSAKRAEEHAGYESFTFAMLRQGVLVPIATVHDGLIELEQQVNMHKTERFGPVQMIEPGALYRLSIGDAYRSSRRKSGFECRSVEILGAVEMDASVGAVHDLTAALHEVSLD